MFRAQFPTLTRRAFVSTLAAATAIPAAGLAQAGQPLHQTVAEKVRALADGRSVSLRLLRPTGSGGNLDPVIARFGKMTGVSVIATDTRVDDINTELALDALSKRHSFDLALPATFGLPGLVSSGVIRPIGDFAARHEPAGFRDEVLYRVGDSFDNELYGFQADGDAYMMFYHKDLLENAEEQARYADRFGTALKPPLTWQELDRQIGYFNRPDDGLWGGLLFRTPEYLAWEWWVRFHAKGAWPFSPEMDPQILSDAGVEALEEMIRVTASLCPEAETLGLFGNWKRYSRGDVYCNIGWGGSQKYFNGPYSAMRGRMIFGPTPGGMIGDTLLATPYFNWGWSYVVARSSAETEISYLFALFASSPEISTLAVRQANGFFDPFRPEHYTDAGIRDAYSPEFLKVHRASMEGAIPDFYIKDREQYFRVLSEWLLLALRGQVAPEKALQRITQRWQIITNASGRALQQERWRRLRSQYPARARAILRDGAA